MLQKINEIRKKLNALGLSDKESHVYLNLAKFDKTGIGKLSIETGLTRQNLYNYLKSLQDKNLVGEIKESNNKKFFAKNINNLKHSFQQKIELADLLDNEISEYKLKYSNGIKLHKGLSKIRQLFIDRVKKQSPDGQIFSNETSSLDFTGKFMGDKFNLYENIRLNRKFKVNVIITMEKDSDIYHHTELKTNQRLYNETRAVYNAAFGFSALYIWPDRIWILLKDHAEEFEVIEIVSHEITAGFKFYFQYIWSSAKIIYKSND